MGAEAIYREFVERGVPPPCVRTIGRMLERNGVLDDRRRIRRPPPPRGWYLADLSEHSVEMDQFDAVTGLVIKGGTDVEVLNGISLHGGLAASWPESSVTSTSTRKRLVEHWRKVGLPAYAQFDNDTRFQGPHQHKDAVGLVIRLCRSLGVTPVFAPPREPGFQASIESYNGLWQSKVWGRSEHKDLEDLRGKSDAYVAASRKRHARRIESAPARTLFPEDWEPQEKPPLNGRVVFLRRADERGQVSLLGRVFPVDPNRPNRLVRADVLYDQELINFYGLRRSTPCDHLLLRETPYSPKRE
jgi:hypothetical protein